MVRTPFIDSTGLKRGAWSEEEDNKLRAYVHRYGHWNWRQLPKFAGLSRCGKSCRLRWMNYLKPGVRRGNYTPQEEDLIVELYRQFGSKWSEIAAQLPGRVDNDIKNHWNSHLRKKVKVQKEEDHASEQIMEKEVSTFPLNQIRSDQLEFSLSNYQAPSLSYDSTVLQNLEFDPNQESPSVSMESIWDSCDHNYNMQVPSTFKIDMDPAFASYLDETDKSYDSAVIENLDYDANEESPGTASMESIWDSSDHYMQVPSSFEDQIMHPAVLTSYLDEIDVDYFLSEWLQ